MYFFCCVLQYTQNPDLRHELFATAGTVLVEASADDTRWGIGSIKDDRTSWNRRTWRGENWLGEILTEVRNELMTMVCFMSIVHLHLCIAKVVRHSDLVYIRI